MTTSKHPVGMDLGMTERLIPIHEKVSAMIQDDVLPVDEDARYAKRKQNRGYRQVMRQADHDFSSASILTTQARFFLLSHRLIDQVLISRLPGGGQD